MIDTSSAEFIILVTSYVIFMIYVVKHFWKDMGKNIAKGMSKKEARAAVHKDYRRGLLNPKHKMFIPGLYLGGLFIYWVVSGLLR